MRAALAVVAAAVVLAPIEMFAQTPMVPYFGKNQIRYTNFRWNIYTTDHFEIYFYPEEEQHLERIAGYAESAYQHVSSDLKHDLAFKVPLIIFKTSSEFQQENVIPGAAVEGVAAFAEPERDRMLLPLDEPRTFYTARSRMSSRTSSSSTSFRRPLSAETCRCG